MEIQSAQIAEDYSNKALDVMEKLASEGKLSVAELESCSNKHSLTPYKESKINIPNGRHIIDCKYFAPFCANSYNSYKTYIRKYSETVPGFLNNVDHFFVEQDFIGAQNIISEAINTLHDKKEQTADKDAKDKMSNWISALKSLRRFAKNCDLSSDAFTIPQSKEINVSNKSRTNPSKPAFKETAKIDGSEALLTALGGIKQYLQLALRESYFFDKRIVERRIDEFVNLWLRREPIPVRYSRKGKYAYSNPLIDKDGNRCVRQNINKYSGYTISTGQNSIFQNYRISHLYGNAFDPRYFTNFWNIVLVPEWANCLLEKGSAKAGTSASRILNTYMAICAQLYSESISPLNELAILESDKRIQKIISLSPKTLEDVVGGTYNIQIISEEKNSAGISQIATTSITL